MNKTRVIQVFQSRLARLPIAKHPALIYNPWMEGYRGYTFGGRAGPSVGVINLFHELAHAAQFGAEQFSERAHSGGFEFKIPQVYIFNRLCTEPITSQATLRELDTFAHQLHLMQAAYKNMDVTGQAQRFAHVMRLMHDWYNVEGADDEGRQAQCADWIEERHAQLTTAEVLDKLEGWLDMTQQLFEHFPDKVLSPRPTGLRLRVLHSPLFDDSSTL